MPEVTLFKTHCGHCHVVTNFGNFQFVAGRYFTENKQHEEKLKKLAETGEFGIYIDPQEPSVDPKAATPADTLRKKIIEEFLAEQRQVADMGKSHADPAAIQRAMANTASSPVNGNGLASQVNEQVKSQASGDALTALEKLKNKS